MSFEVITTPPITVHSEVITNRLITPIVADFFAFTGGAILIGQHGVIGKASSKLDNDLENAKDTIATYTKNTKYQISDASDKLNKHFETTVNELVDSEILVIKKKDMRSCECSIVYVEEDTIQSTRLEKLRNLYKKCGQLTCVHCDTIAKVREEVVLCTTNKLFGSLRIDNNNVIQDSYMKKSLSIIESNINKEKTVSRPVKIGDESSAIILKGVDFRLDPDFTSKLSTIYPYESGIESLLICAGAKQHERLLGALALGNVLYKDKRAEILMHPRISINVQDQLNPLKSEAIQSLSKVRLLRLIMSLGSSWDKNTTVINEHELKIVYSMCDREYRHEKEDRPFLSAKEVIKLFNPAEVRKSLKYIRSGKPNSTLQSSLLNSFLS